MKKIRLKDQLGRVIRVPTAERKVPPAPTAPAVQQQPAPSAVATLWRLIREVPGNLQRLAAGAGDLVAGPNVTLVGDLAGRLVGAGNVTVSATGGGGGGGCLQFVGEVVLAADSSLIQFTGLDSSDAIGWRMEANMRAAAGQILQSRIRVNGDAGDLVNYNRQTITANGTSVSTARANNNEAFYTSTNGGAAAGWIEIRPTATGMLATMMYARDTGAANLRYQTAALEWVGAGPINSLALASQAANNFAAGSEVRLYKITATPPTPDYGGLVNALDDAAAAAAGVAVGELYRDGSTLMVRVA